MNIKSCPASVKAVPADDASGTFEALVSVFGNVDSYGDRVMPGAFADTLAEWQAKGDPIPVIWSHRSEDPDYHIGWVDEAEERPEGLWVKGQLDLDHPKAAQVHRLLKGRRVTQFSFAYDVLDGAQVKNGAETAYELRKLKLWEVGPTLIGVNQATELLAVKAAGELAAELKAGRVLSGKNEGKLRDAYDAIGSVLAALGDNDSQAKAGEPVNGATAPEEPTHAAPAGVLSERIALLTADLAV